MSLLDRILLWLEKYLPNMLLAFGLGYKLSAAKAKRVSMELEKALLDKELTENELKVQKKFDGLSDSQLIDSILSSRSKGEQ